MLAVALHAGAEHSVDLRVGESDKMHSVAHQQIELSEPTQSLHRLTKYGDKLIGTEETPVSDAGNSIEQEAEGETSP